jgi:ADP-ribose pyrophosphatase YjhB (NUDIX family)
MAYIEWLRSQVGHRRVFLAFASVVLRDNQNRILLQKRTDFNLWGLPGGVLELGESIRSCAKRELCEETGLIPGDFSLVGIYSGPKYEVTYPNGDQVQQYTVCLQAQLQGGQMRVDGSESSDQRFFDPEEIPYNQIPLWYRDMLQAAIAGGSPSFEPPFSQIKTVAQIEDIRARVGRSAYIGMGAVAVLRDDRGRLLMVKRTDDGQWCLPGGFSNLGENAAFTAVRETIEETGLQVTPSRLLGVFSPTDLWVYPNGDQTQSLITLFECQVVGGNLQPDQIEISAVAWMSPADVIAKTLHPLMRSLHRAVVEHLDDGYFLL